MKKNQMKQDMNLSFNYLSSQEMNLNKVKL
jgi:hypothetical protein